MQKDDDTSKNDVPEDDISGAITADEPTERKPGELERTNRVGGDLAGVIRQEAAGPGEVLLDRTATKATIDQPLWAAIRNRTRAIGFNRYNQFINALLFGDDFDKYDLLDVKDKDPELGEPKLKNRFDDLRGRSTLKGIDSYNLLKLATDAFLIFECGLVGKPGDDVLEPGLFEFDAKGRRLGQQPGISVRDINIGLRRFLDISSNLDILPYLDGIVDQIVVQNENKKKEMVPYYEAMLRYRLSCPSMVELIWSYWHEEGMLVQTVNAIALRFQNKRLPVPNPLANLELDPLRPLNNLFRGYIQDEINRLSVGRRAYAYDQYYGLNLVGKAVPGLHSADVRSKFPEAFHNLLHRTALFYREDDNTTVDADAVSLLKALGEVHVILAESAHNQYGDLPWTARREMLIMQWLLARQETKEFLRGRSMVPYPEPWMGAVDDMKRLQHWGDVTVTHFHELAKFGEQILLSIRFGDWSDINDQELARNWARYWRPEVQGYIQAHNAVTGVKPAADITDGRLAENRYGQPAVENMQDIQK